MSRNSSLDSFDNQRHQFHSSSPSSDESRIQPFSPIPSGDTRFKTKLSKLLKGANTEPSSMVFPKNLELKMDQKDKLKKRDSFRMNENKELLESKDLIIDPVSEKGFLPLLRRMKQKIRKLGLTKAKSGNETNLALIKSRLKMRRKSDASKWSGGVSHLEQVSAFLVYDYVPAITLQDVSVPVRRDTLSPMFRPLIEKPSLRIKLDREQSLSTNGSPTLGPEKRESESMSARSPVVTFLLPELNKMSCDIKDTKIINLEDYAKTQDELIELDRFRAFLLSVGVGIKDEGKTPIVMVNQEHLRVATAGNDAVNMISFDLQNQKTGEFGSVLGRRNNESMTRKKTIVERRASLSEKMKQKIQTATEKSKTKLITEIQKEILPPSSFAPPAVTLKPTISSSGIKKTRHTRVHSQDSLGILKHLESKADEKKEDKRSNKNIRIQTLSKKKLAEIVSPELPTKMKTDTDKPISTKPKPKQIAISFRETVRPDPEINVKPLLLKNDKQTIQSHRASPSWSANNSIVQQAYINHNIKQIGVVTKPKKVVKSPLEVELMPVDKRKFLLPRAYAPMKNKLPFKKASMG